MNDPEPSESLNFALFDRIPEGVCVLRSDWVVLFWNKTLESWTKIPRTQIVGSPLDAYYPHFREPQYQGRLDPIFRGGPPTLFSTQLHKYIIPIPYSPQHLRRQQMTVTALPTENPKEFYAILVIQDVTDLTHQSHAYRLMRDQALAEIRQREKVEAALRESEARYAKIFEEGPLGMALFDEKHCFSQVNRRFCEMLGYSEAELVGRSVLEITHPQDRDQTLFWLEQLISGICESYRLEKRYCRKDQAILWVMVTVSLIRNPDGIPLYKLSLVEDITERKQSEAELTQAHSHLQRWVLELEKRNQEIILLRDLSNALQACLTWDELQSAIAACVQAIFPQQSGGVILLTQDGVQELCSWGIPLNHAQLLQTYQCIMEQHQTGYVVLLKDCCCENTHPEFSPEFAYIPLQTQNQELGLFYLEVLPTLEEFDTRTQQQLAQTVAETLSLALMNLKLRETLHELSIRDALTGLFNRRYLEAALQRELLLAHRKQYAVGLIMVDVDHFKQVNDTYGHVMGDRVLQDIAQFLLSQIRDSDIACRYGGEELLLILPDATLETTRQRAEQIRQGIKQLKIEQEGQTVGKITLSLGVACFPEQGQTWEDLIRAADQALYEAKAQGRDRVITSPAVPSGTQT